MASIITVFKCILVANKRSHMTFDALQIVPCIYVDLIERNTYRAHRENLMYYP